MCVMSTFQIQSLDESVSDMFQHLDISCNGSLCASELQDFFKEKGREFSEENVKMIFDELDADKSGSVRNSPLLGVQCLIRRIG